VVQRGLQRLDDIVVVQDRFEKIEVIHLEDLLDKHEEALSSNAMYS
jgi:deoxyhypusine synthase